MSVLLRRSGLVRPDMACDGWFVIGAGESDLPISKKTTGMAAKLETAFDQITDAWFALAQQLGRNPTAILAHAPSCTANVSDLGVMMAWSKLVTDFSARAETTVVICDDPWVFRHLANIEGVVAGKAPSLLWPTLKYALRGFASRLSCALRLTRQCKDISRPSQKMTTGRPAFMVYGHPRSTADGFDGYFGNLLTEFPNAQRILHVDCLSERANELALKGRAVSLHAWGRLSDLIRLPFVKWKPDLAAVSNEWRWLVKRAAVLEGGTGQAAMIRWQQVCQRRWLEDMKPICVLWPWENHGWERDFVRAAREMGVRTIGYQHSVVGPQMLNYSRHSNADGLASIPDMVLCTGKATFQQLKQWAIPKERLNIGGALRIPEVKKMVPSETGSLYMALSFDQETARQMIAAAESLASRGYTLLVKNHPMQPTVSTTNKNIEVTQKFFSEFDNLKAVIYAASTVGLEAAIAGLPTIRFQTEGKIALDILPPNVRLPASDCDGLVDALTKAEPVAISRSDVFSPVNPDVWKEAIVHE